MIQIPCIFLTSRLEYLLLFSSNQIRKNIFYNAISCLIFFKEVIVFCKKKKTYTTGARLFCYCCVLSVCLSVQMTILVYIRTNQNNQSFQLLASAPEVQQHMWSSQNGLYLKTNVYSVWLIYLTRRESIFIVIYCVKHCLFLYIAHPFAHVHKVPLSKSSFLWIQSYNFVLAH